MKKQTNNRFILLSLLFLILFALSSCSSTHQTCAAYAFNDVK